jgi:serine-type D-Ala-D-Ala carboxypeptidase (penicillin-binding protein 5/6)
MTAEHGPHPAPCDPVSVTYRRRNRVLTRLGLCAAGGLVVGGLLALPFSGDDGSSGSMATTTVIAVVPSLPTTVVAPTIPPTSSAAVSTTLDPPTTVTPAPTSTAASDVPTVPGVEAAAYALIDADTGKVLAGSNVDQQLAVGSLMKLLTAYVVMQAGEPTKTVVVPELDVVQDESIIGLAPGMRYQRDLLLRALLVVSAGDAAQALAIDVAGSEEAFVDQMNKAAAELGLADTVAANETGLDADGAHSSAGDIAELSRVLLQDPTFRDTVDNRTAQLFGKTRPATNQAFLTGYPGASGVKTGHTTQAGYCLAASATRDGRSLIAVVLGTPSQAVRTTQAEAILDWGFAQAD